jgi:membrane fusion protein, heavy metal efflux system
VRIGVDLENPGKTLKPAMLTTALIEGKSTSRQVVPAAAVVRENDADHLFVETSPGVVRLTRVTLGSDKAGVRAVLDKLPGNRIVTQGAFHLNNERLKRLQEKTG